jgi:hypothetical protein
MPIILATLEAEVRRLTVQSQPQANSLQDPISSKTKKKSDVVTQEVEQLPKKHEALSSNSSTAGKKKEEEEESRLLLFICHWVILSPLLAQSQSHLDIP